MRLKPIVGIAVLGAAVACSQAADADTVTYWGYSSGSPAGAPGGSTYSGSGNKLAAGGSTGQYGGFNPAAYTNLYWVVDTVAGAPYLGASTSDALAFDSSRSNLSGGVLVFDGSSTVNTASGIQSIFGELQVTVSNAGGALGLDSPSLHNGMAAADGGAVNVTGPFTANFQFLMGATSSSALTDAADYWSSLHTTNGSGGAATLYDSYSGGFYYTPAPVPLPASAWMLLSGLGIGAMARRKRAA